MKRVTALVLSVCLFGACGVGLDEGPEADISASQQQGLVEGCPQQTTILPRPNPRALPQDPIPELNDRKPKRGSPTDLYRKE
jgi:hypothetical protein